MLQWVIVEWVMLWLLVNVMVVVLWTIECASASLTPTPVSSTNLFMQQRRTLVSLSTSTLSGCCAMLCCCFDVVTEVG